MNISGMGCKMLAVLVLGTLPGQGVPPAWCLGSFVSIWEWTLCRGVLKGRDFFFLLRTALKDRPKGPPTANRQRRPTANCQPLPPVPVFPKKPSGTPCAQPWLVAVGGWRRLAVGSWQLAVGGGWWWLAAVGGWRLVVYRNTFFFPVKDTPDPLRHCPLSAECHVSDPFLTTAICSLWPLGCGKYTVGFVESVANTV